MTKSEQRSDNTTNRQVPFIRGTEHVIPNLPNATTCARRRGFPGNPWRIGPRTWMAVLAVVLSLLPSMAAAQSLAVSNLTSTSATVTISSHTGDWWYLVNNHANCTKATGTSVDLTGLTPNSTYTFSAWSSSACTPSTVYLAEVDVVTPAQAVVTLAASAVTDTTATLTIENHTGNWYYKYTAPTGGQCSSAQTGTTASLASLTPGTNYTFKAYSNSGCTTVLATAAAFLTKPGQTTGVTVAVLSTKLKVSWTAVTSATGYTVQWKSGNQDYASSRQATATGTSHTVTGLTNSTTYTLRVRATNGTGDGAWSADATGTPAAVTLTVSNVTQTTATLTIANYEGAWSYTPDNGTTCGTVNSGGTVDSANLSNLTVNTSYTYVAYNTTNCGSTAAEEIARKTFTTLAAVELTASDVTQTTATLTIANYAGAWSYKGNQSGATCTSVSSGTTTANLINLTLDTSYTYIAYNTTNCGSTSAEIARETFTTLVTAELTASAVTDTTATLTIANYSGTWYYKYTTSGGGPCSSGQTGLTANLTNLRQGTEYAFRAYSDAQCATLLTSAPAIFTTKPGPMGTVQISAVIGKIDLQWKGPAGATKYRVQWKAAGQDYDASHRQQDIDLEIYSINTVGAFTYTVRVRAGNASGWGAWSAEVSARSVCSQCPSLTASSVTVTSATLTMSNYSGNWRYKRTNPAGGTCKNAGFKRSVDLDDLDAGTSYTYQAYTDSNCSTELETATAFLTKPAQVTGVTTATGNGALAVSWTAVTSATGYKVQWKSGTENYDDNSRQATATGTSHTVTGLTIGTTYTLRVKATNATGDGAWSAEATGTPLLTASPVEATTATLTASAVKGATATLTINGHTGDWSYQVSPRPPGTLSCTEVLDDRTAVTLTGLTPGTTYTSTVYSDRDCTQKIASQTFTTLNEPPTFPRGRTINAQSYVQHTSVALTLPAATGGNPPLTYALAPGLPAGLTFDPGTRTLAGTPTALQEATRYTYTVTDQDGEQATLTFTITVRAAADKAIIENGLAAQGRALLSGATGVIGARFRNPGASSLDGVGACAGEAPRNEDRGDTDTPPAPDGEPDCLTGILGTVAQAVLAMSGNGGGPADADSLGLADTDDTRPRGPRGGDTASQPAGNWEHLVWGRSFALPLQASSLESAWTLWGAGDVQGFQGAPRQGKYDGQVRSLYLGVDARWQEQWLAGAALAQSWGTIDYVTGTGKSAGRLETTLTSVYPYVRGILGTGMEVWALGGYGWGEAEDTLQGAAGTRETSDLTMAMGATGARQPMTEWGGVQVAVVGGLGYLTLGTEAGTSLVSDLDVAVQRARLAVEAAGAYGGLAPYVQVGGRYDGGDGQTGAGLETVAGLRYTSERLEFEVRGRWLAAHAAEGYEEYGGLARLAVKPRADGTGWQMDVAPRWGAAQGAGLLGGGAALLDGGAMPGAGLGGVQSATPRALSLESQVGYGVGVLDGYGVLTPYGGFALTGQETRQYRLGARLEVAERLNLSLEGIRREAARQQPANQGVQLQLEGRF